MRRLACTVVIRSCSTTFCPGFVNQLPTIDPLLLALIPLPCLIAACVACYLPARRAARVDPNLALRQP